MSESSISMTESIFISIYGVEPVDTVYDTVDIVDVFSIWVDSTDELIPEEDEINRISLEKSILG